MKNALTLLTALLLAPLAALSPLDAFAQAKPEVANATKPLMWTRTERKSRVVYLQLGHDHAAYENPNYRELVARSIMWTTLR